MIARIDTIDKAIKRTEDYRGTIACNMHKKKTRVRQIDLKREDEYLTVLYELRLKTIWSMPTRKAR